MRLSRYRPVPRADPAQTLRLHSKVLRAPTSGSPHNGVKTDDDSSAMEVPAAGGVSPLALRSFALCLSELKPSWTGDAVR